MKFTKKGWIFAQTPIWTICDPNLSDGALRLFSYLAWRQGNDSSCWPSVPTMARDLSVSQDTIRRRLRALEENDYLITKHRIGRSSDYTLVADPNDASANYTPTPRNSKGGSAQPPATLQGGPRKSAGGPLATLQGGPRKSAGHDDKKGREEGDRDEVDEMVSLWTSIQDTLQTIMDPGTFEAHFALAEPVALDQDKLTVALPSERSLEATERRLNGRLTEAVRAQHHVQLVFSAE